MVEASSKRPETTFGRYRLLDRLGEGGMAEVFRAKSFGVEGFEKTLVIKRILPKLAAHAKFVDLFVHEAKLAVRLSHANIVQVFDLGRVDLEGQAPSYFIAMEYVAGLDLASVLARARKTKTPVPIGLAVFVAAEVAKALDHAHRRRDDQARSLGIVHRDISPQNILLSWEGEVKVTDFGIAKAIDSIDEEGSQRGKVRGKLAYMSPEQTRADPLDGRSDLFSLGAVLYEMIAGSNPFTAPTSYETLRRVQASEYPPLSLTRPDAPKELVEILEKMLAKDPKDRFEDAGRLHEALLGFFYETGDRFGASNLADFLEPFHEAAGLSAIARGGVFDEEPTGANDRTPVEIPNAGARATGDKAIEREGTAPRTTELGERREVTALVLRFAADRSHADGKSSPPSVVDQRARDVLARYGARVVESGPMHLAALFGLGDADGRDTDAAARAALVLLRSAGGSISAGLHVAKILVDPAGAPVSDERLVALIAEAQALARATEGRLVASALAARIIRSDFSTEELSRSGVFEEPSTESDRNGRLRTPVVEGSHVVTSARSPSLIYGRFIGRHDELKLLGDILAGATRRRAQVVMLEGDKGIGKTRLLAEMERRLEKGSYNVGFYVAACPKNGASEAWSGLRSMLHVLCGIQEGDDEERIHGVVPRLRALGLQPDEINAVLAELGAAKLSGAPSPQEASASLRTAFARMVQRLCDDRLQVFAWDDAHAIDEATIDAVLSTLARFQARGGDPASGAVSSGSGLRAVFLFATREEPPAAIAKAAVEWEGNNRAPRFHRVTLGELGEDDGARLIGTRVGGRILPPELLSFCRERAGGHPLFIEELVKELMESGSVEVANGQVTATLDGRSAVPRTLRTLIAGRVSRLEPADRALMQAAAILGAPIPTPVLAALLKMSVAHVDRAVASLATKDLLRAMGPELAGFASPMHGEIVLDSIPPEARRELHAAAASAFGRVFGDETIDHVERVANHLYEAGDRDRAADRYAAAAAHKARLGQLEPSIRLLLRAIDLANLDDRPPEHVGEWLNALATAVSRVRIAPSLKDLAVRALRRIDQAGAEALRVRARADVAQSLASVNLFDAATALLEEAHALAGADRDLEKRLLVVEVELGSRSGDFARARRAADALTEMGGLDDSRVLLNLAHATAAWGDAKEAIALLDNAEKIDDANDLSLATEREKTRGLVLLYAHDFAKAVDACRRAVDLARSAGFRFALGASLHNLGDAARRLGDLPLSYASLTESREIALAADHERLVTLDRIHLAYLDGLSGAKDAVSLLIDLGKYVEARGYWTDAIEAQLLLGMLYAHLGKKDEAKKELEAVLATATERGNRLVAEDAKEALAKL